jgi:hypothetical protein
VVVRVEPEALAEPPLLDRLANRSTDAGDRHAVSSRGSMPAAASRARLPSLTGSRNAEQNRFQEDRAAHHRRQLHEQGVVDVRGEVA